jgi:hypothetical protein
MKCFKIVLDMQVNLIFKSVSYFLMYSGLTLILTVKLFTVVTNALVSWPLPPKSNISEQGLCLPEWSYILTSLVQHANYDRNSLKVQTSGACTIKRLTAVIISVM